jgi:hypothetical protein
MSHYSPILKKRNYVNDGKVSKCSQLTDLHLFTYCYIIRFNPAYLLMQFKAVTAY